ncbi:MAG: glycoside hydrolase family 2 TIM barrel-domain containing protein [Planctomycetia bacterium]|nr:glycoside hydrolase family 2 TIM barrel-domain containing protein [Planctomycetia bacterium]
MRRSMLAAVLIGLAISSADGAEWKPAKGPLMTRWAADVSPAKVLPEYPRPTLVRDAWKNLNGLWEYAVTDIKSAQVPAKFEGEILVPFPIESALSGVMRRVSDQERLWYRRSFDVPSDWRQGRVLLHFGAVDWETTVNVNGKALETHRGGFDNFSFDITDALVGGAEQELVVSVTDPTSSGTQPRGKQVNNPESIYYTPTTGIWQTVWLEPVAVTSIAALRITPNVDTKSVKIEPVIAGDANGVPLIVTAHDGDTEVAGGYAPAGETIDLTFDQPKLWSPDSPHLYNLRVRLERDGKTIDSATSYCALRKIELIKDAAGVNRIALNGEQIFQVGPLDQGFWPDGLFTAPTDEALKFDLDETIRLGFNMTRKHVKVEPERWYYWCDKLGLLVWQDMPSGDQAIGPNGGEITRTKASAAQYELELAEMLRERHNHPSIITWVVFNEGWGQFDTVRVTNETKQRDPSRLVDCASGWNDFPAGDLVDVHVYPGPGAPPLDEKRATVLGEFGGLGLGVDGHTWTDKTWGYRGAASQDDLTVRYETMLRASWKLLRDSGLNAVVYTQITDVETEANGLYTYDRAVLKVNADRIRAANLGQLPDLVDLVKSSQQEEHIWRYTFTKPAEDWFAEKFNDKTWQQGPAGFGTEGTPGAAVRTTWSGESIWLRREVELDAAPTNQVFLYVHHDEDCEVYLNGILAAKLDGYSVDYEAVPISPEAQATLRAGQNTIAVHCSQTGGGQYIDVGLLESEPQK